MPCGRSCSIGSCCAVVIDATSYCSSSRSATSGSVTPAPKSLFLSAAASPLHCVIKAMRRQKGPLDATKRVVSPTPQHDRRGMVIFLLCSHRALTIIKRHSESQWASRFKSRNRLLRRQDSCLGGTQVFYQKPLYKKPPWKFLLQCHPQHQ